MKELSRSIGETVIITAILYITHSFIYSSVNPANWSEVAIGYIIGIFISGFSDAVYIVSRKKH